MVTIHTINVTTSLLTKLISIQKSSNLSDYKFADKLGITRILWYTTRIGQRKIGLALLRAIVRTYPDLSLHVIEFLRSEDHDREQDNEQ